MSGVYDVTDAFTDLLRPATVVMQDQGGYANGHWEKGENTSIDTTSVCLPVRDGEVNQLDLGGYLGTGLYKFYFKDFISVAVVENATLTPGDTVIFENKTYTILKISDYRYQGGYVLCYCELVN